MYVTGESGRGVAQEHLAHASAAQACVQGVGADAGGVVGKEGVGHGIASKGGGAGRKLMFPAILSLRAFSASTGY
ncbi:hypothetical protein GCM10026982_54770 [Nocardiopsis aegyptia]